MQPDLEGNLMKIKLWQCLTAMLLLLPGSLFADDFYKGKTIRVIVGGSAGGGFDIYTRAMARHMGKHIPGNPSLVVENMTGAGTFIAAKYLHSSAKPDGLDFRHLQRRLDLGPRSGDEGRRYRYERIRISRRAGAGQHGVRVA